MLSKAQIKHITALHTKKYRTEHSQFFVEGKKSIQELLKSSFVTEELYYTEELTEFVQQYNDVPKTCINHIALRKISNQKKPEGVCAVVDMPAATSIEIEDKKIIALDKIRDPGNMGTILRIADWFGVDSVLCSADCVELYNPKVIQSSMGSVFHIPCEYVDLEKKLSKTKNIKLAAMLNGDSIYDTPALEKGILVIGNEANGISEDILSLCDKSISIPAAGQAESLNAAMACGILSSYLFRN